MQQQRRSSSAHRCQAPLLRLMRGRACGAHLFSLFPFSFLHSAPFSLVTYVCAPPARLAPNPPLLSPYSLPSSPSSLLPSPPVTPASLSSASPLSPPPFSSSLLSFSHLRSEYYAIRVAQCVLRVAQCVLRQCSMRVACCVLRNRLNACCVLRNACCVLRASRCVCCVLLDACCVLRNRLNACCANFFTITMLLLVLFDVVPNCVF